MPIEALWVNTAMPLTEFVLSRLLTLLTQTSIQFCHYRYFGLNVGTMYYENIEMQMSTGHLR